MFERFTERARQVVVHAQEEARGIGRQHIGIDHLLLGLLREREGLAAMALSSLGVTLESARRHVGEPAGRRPGMQSGMVPFTLQAKEALNHALEEALELGHDYIGTEHVLLGWLRDDDADQILRGLGTDADAVREAVLRLVPPPRRPPRRPPPEDDPPADSRASAMAIDRFTEPARKAVVFAEEEARALRHNYLGTEHLLLGLLRGEDGIAAHVLDTLDIRVEEVRLQVARIVGQGDETATGQIPFTPRTKKVLELAWREALSLGHDSIGTEHILLGLVRENEGIAARILQDFDADAETLRTEIIRMLSGPSRRSAPRGRGGFHIADAPGSASGRQELESPSRLIIACPDCATPIEGVTVTEQQAALQVSMQGGHTCSGCGRRWLISVSAAWRDAAPPSDPEDDLPSRATFWHHATPAHFTMTCLRCNLPLERVTLTETTTPIRIDATAERACLSCEKRWHIAYIVSWDEQTSTGHVRAPG